MPIVTDNEAGLKLFLSVAANCLDLLIKMSVVPGCLELAVPYHEG